MWKTPPQPLSFVFICCFRIRGALWVGQLFHPSASVEYFITYQPIQFLQSPFGNGSAQAKVELPLSSTKTPAFYQFH